MGGIRKFCFDCYNSRTLLFIKIRIENIILFFNAYSLADDRFVDRMKLQANIKFDDNNYTNVSCNFMRSFRLLMSFAYICQCANFAMRGEKRHLQLLIKHNVGINNT